MEWTMACSRPPLPITRTFIKHGSFLADLQEGSANPGNICGFSKAKKLSEESGTVNRINARALIGASNMRSLGILGIVALCIVGCPDADETGNEPGQESAVARIVMPSGKIEVRRPDTLEFTPLGTATTVTRGTTLNCKGGIVTLNFMGCVQVQLGEKTRESELILEGPSPSATGTEYVLGLTKGEVRIDSSSDCPVVLKLPHGQVHGGPGAFFYARLSRYREGRYTAVIQAMSKDNILVSNDFGSVTLPYWSTLRLNEEEAPTIVKQMKDPRQGR
jgi:hypothetical protein